jgi:hypothetical protein
MTFVKQLLSSSNRTVRIVALDFESRVMVRSGKYFESIGTCNRL